MSAFMYTTRRAIVVSGVGVAGALGITGSTVEAREKKSLIVPIACQDGTTVIPWEAPSREDQVERLKKEPFDVLVIGGGATGCGCALDASTRGLNVALIERDDFASGTSGRSTKLIHGGIRYLEGAFKKFDYGSLKLVLEALEEREHMLSAAPFMNKPLPIMIPIYKWWEVPYMWVGCKLYDVFAGTKRFVPKSFFISLDEAMYQFPMLDRKDLKGAVVYYDGQMNDTRMSLTIALTAAQSGAAVCSRVEVIEISKDEKGNANGAVVKDVISGEVWTVYARAVINATGPFSDAIRKMDNPQAEDLIIPASGVHVVLPDHFSPEKMGLIVPKTQDGRVLFFLPWENGTLVGTTDSSSAITMTPCPSKAEIDFIIDEANRYLAKPVKRQDIRAAWSGIRPLAKVPGNDGTTTSEKSRDHVLEVSASNLLTITGGKWTTYRRMAQDTVDKALAIIPDLSVGKNVEPCRTQNMRLVGADRVGQVCGQKFDIITVTLREKYHVDKDVAEHLTRNYGTRALQVVEICKHGYDGRMAGADPVRLLPQYPYLEAEVIFAVRQEYAMAAVDVVARRTRLAFLDSQAAAKVVDRVCALMGDCLGWSRSRRKSEKEECMKYLETMSR